jgi:hypothetical protein
VEGSSQAALYQQTVEELDHQLEGAEGIERRGIVLTFLTRSATVLGIGLVTVAGRRRIAANLRVCGT